MVTVVKGYADLAGERKLHGAAPDVVARELQEAGDETIVAWLPDWLAEEKEIKSAAGCANVVAGRLEHETEKAYLVAVGRDEAWLPKSVVRVFEVADDVDEISIPQTGLADFEEGSA